MILLPWIKDVVRKHNVWGWDEGKESKSFPEGGSSESETLVCRRLPGPMTPPFWWEQGGQLGVFLQGSLARTGSQEEVAKGRDEGSQTPAQLFLLWGSQAQSPGWRGGQLG